MTPTVRSILPLAALLLAAPLTAAPALAQGAAACKHAMGHQSAAVSKLTVTGNGESRTDPDMAMVSLGVTAQAPTAAEAMTQSSTRQAKVLEALKAQGVEAKDIQTSGLNLSPMMDYQDGKAPVVTGYQAQNMVSVRVLNLETLGQVLDGLVAAGANEVQGISFGRQDDQAASDDARVKAVAEARRRAEVLAKAAGLSLGPVLAIRDTVFTGGPEPMAMRALDAKAASSVPIETGQIALAATVQMDFALLPADGKMPGTDCGGDAAQGSADTGAAAQESEGAAPEPAQPGAVPAN